MIKSKQPRSKVTGRFTKIIGMTYTEFAALPAKQRQALLKTPVVHQKKKRTVNRFLQYAVTIGLVVLYGFSFIPPQIVEVEMVSPLPSDFKIVVEPTKTQEPEKPPVNEFEGILSEIIPLTRECGLPDNLVAAQWALETGRAQRSEINNYFGLGPHIKYPSLEANVRDYCLTVRNIASKNGVDVEKATAKEILIALQSGKTRYEGHNEDPMLYVDSVMEQPEWALYE